MRFRTSQIAAAVGGTISGEDEIVEGANHDSRLISPGQLFVPIVAERDGHSFIGQAIEAGASSFFTSQENTATNATAIHVADTLAALGELGKLARGRIDGEVIGITGSVGKTTVKDLVHAVLAVAGRVHSSAASFNNEIGVPITLVGVPESNSRVVVELGARGIGHIRELCAIAQPTVGVVTKIALVHGEYFGSLEDIAAGKGELIEQLPTTGTAVLNADDERVLAMASRTTADVLTFGLANGDVRATQIEVAADLSLRLQLHTPWGATQVQPSVRGVHNAANVAAAAAVGLSLGLSLDQVAAGLPNAKLSPMRMAITYLDNGTTVLDDSYNANPTSMKAALNALANLPAKRHVAVLGVMAELGEGAEAMHAEVAAEAARLGIEVVAVAAPAYRAEEVGGRTLESVDAALNYLGTLGSDIAVLAKGSRVAELDRLVQALIDN